MKFDFGDIPADLADEADGNGANRWSRAAEATRRTDEQVPRERRALPEKKIKIGDLRAGTTMRIQPMSVRELPSRTRACSACSMPSSSSCCPVDIPPVTGAGRTNEGERKASDERKFSALAFKIMTDPLSVS